MCSLKRSSCLARTESRRGRASRSLTCREINCAVCTLDTTFLCAAVKLSQGCEELCSCLCDRTEGSLDGCRTEGSLDGCSCLCDRTEGSLDGCCCLCDRAEGSLDDPADAGRLREVPEAPARKPGADAGLHLGRLPERCGLGSAGCEGQLLLGRGCETLPGRIGGGRLLSGL